MASSYTSSLGLVLPVQGELSGTWGDTVNNYLTTYVDSAVAGQLAISLTGNLSLSKTTGTSLGSTSSQYAILNVTPSASTWTITVPAASQIYHINNLSSTHTFTIKATGQTGFVVAAAEKCVVAYNGTDFVRVGSTSVFGSPSTAMTIDTAGIIGVGVTPSAWGGNSKYIQMGNGAGANGAFGVISNNLTQVITNAYYDGTNYKYIAAASTQASAYNQTVGQHQWFTAAPGTSGNNVTFTQAMTLDASGNLGIGTSSPGAKLEVSSVTDGDTIRISFPSAATGTNGGGLQFRAYTNSAVLVEQGRIQTICTDGTASYAGDMRFMTANAGALSEKMRLNASGNLGLGATPSAWGASKAIVVATRGISLSGNTDSGSVSLNAYDNSGWKFAGTSALRSARYDQYDGGHYWFTGNSGTAGNAITFTQAMTLDASGNLCIGITTPGTSRLQVTKTSGINTTIIGWSDNVTSTGRLSVITGGVGIGSDGVMAFSTNQAGTDTFNERMRLDSSGNLGLGVTPSAWSDYKAIQLPNGGSISGFTASALPIFAVSSNSFFVGGVGDKYVIDGLASRYIQNQGVHQWNIAPSGTAGNAITFTTAMTLNASGNLLLNTTTLTAASIGTSGTFQINSEAISRGSNAGWFWENRSGGTTSNTNWYGWYTTGGTVYLWNGGANAASINPSTGVYTALSDRNKKKDFEPSAIGLNEVMRLKPTLFRMLDDADDSAKKLGFIAQDVADVIPQAYVEHRAVDAVGKDSVYIGLDDRPFIAALTKAIQEQQAMIQSLTDRISQLEAK
jgi:hypothetical protein